MQSSSCRKEKNANEPIIGKWKLVRMTGGIGGIDITADQWGHSQSYAFNTEQTYALTMDSKINKGRYALSTGTSAYNQKPVYYVTLDGGPQRIQYEFAHDTLVLSADGISDVMYEWYVKQ